MKYALINPNWSFEGSIYFGCRDPHLPLEYGYAKALLEVEGHEVELIDAQLEALDSEAVVSRVADFQPDITVVTTAPSYLFWRCAPPELRIPQETIEAVRPVSNRIVGVGPHASTTPRATLRKLNVDGVVLGECEDVLPALAGDWSAVSSIACRRGEQIVVQGGLNATNMERLPALRWSGDLVARHHHHHHRFDAQPKAPGGEMETSRGCPYTCTFCAKENFRNKYRRRPVPTVLEELDHLVSHGVEYIYFIDEIFLPNRALLEGIAERDIHFGVQTRIDLWNHDMLDLLGRAGCVSIEAGVESITVEGRDWLDKKCKLTTYELADRLVYAKQRVPFVQANLIEMQHDDAVQVDEWRKYVIDRGVWANQPVPLFPYPGSPDYTRLFGPVDDDAWERAHDYYLKGYDAFSDIQDARPVPLVQLEQARP